MIGYASRTGTKRNLKALRDHGWRLLVSRAGRWRTEGFAEWAAENGAFADFLASRPFDEEEFERFLKWVSEQPIRPLWIAIPDIVEGGLSSLDLSRKWLRKFRRRKAWRGQRFMLVVQDGMEPKHIRRLIGPDCGIFIGGSTKWKLATMRQWAALAHQRGALCHCGRVNSEKRIRLCEAAGIDSFDGTNASRHASVVPRLDRARRQMDIEGFIARAA